MKNIIFEWKNKEELRGLYHGQPFAVRIKDKRDSLNVLTDDEAIEVLVEHAKQFDENQMLRMYEDSIVRVCIEEGHELTTYCLEVKTIDEQGYDDEGDYYCVAYGKGVTEYDEEFASELTHRIEASNIDMVFIDCYTNSFNKLSYEELSKITVDAIYDADLKDKFLGTLWSHFENTPADESGEYIDDDFYIWEKGSAKSEIWNWFDDEHSKGLIDGIFEN